MSSLTIKRTWMQTSKRSESVILIHGKALVHIHGNTDQDDVLDPSNDTIMYNVLLIAGELETFITAVSQLACWCDVMYTLGMGLQELRPGKLGQSSHFIQSAQK